MIIAAYYGEQINSGASEVELAKFKLSVKEELQKDLPTINFF